MYREKIGTSAWIGEKETGKNADPKVVVERYLKWAKTHKRKIQTERT